jgi:RNA polymerase sigma-70 factor (ECF subfamily)
MNSTINQVQARVAPSARYAEWSDEDLLLRYCQAGDRRAFEELVHRYERELFGYLRHYLGDAEMAEDAFQATFLQVHLKCGQFEQGRKVRPWLYTVATNQAIDAQRRNRRHRMVSLSRRAQGNGQDEESGCLEDVLGSQESDPLARAESSELHGQVRRSVDQLPEPLREVLLLVYYQGLKYREAAQVLDIPVGTVKSRLHAAIGKLNQAITPVELPGNG